MYAKLLRIVVCVAIGGYLIDRGISMMTDSRNTVITQSFGFASIGMAFLIVIFAFNPEQARRIISEITRIIRRLLP